MLFTLTEQGTSTLVTITAEQFQPLVDALTGTYSVSNILTVVGVGVGAVGAIVLTIWGVKKIASMISTAFTRGKIRL